MHTYVGTVHIRRKLGAFASNTAAAPPPLRGYQLYNPVKKIHLLITPNLIAQMLKDKMKHTMKQCITSTANTIYNNYRQFTITT